MHTLGGMVAGTGAGALIGLAGGYLPQATSTAVDGLILGVLGLALGLRELGFLPLRIPQVPRQTTKTWFLRFGPVQAPFLWGLDLGSGLTTYVRYGGYWLLPAAVLLRGGVWYGGAVLGLFALGRVGAVVVASLGMRRAFAAPSPDEGMPLHTPLMELWRQNPAIHREHGYGVLAASAVLLVSLAVAA